MEWKLIGHSHQIADTGDYDGHYEITDGNISILTKDDDDETLQEIVDVLNKSNCEFFQDDWLKCYSDYLRSKVEFYETALKKGLTWEDIQKNSEIDFDLPF